MKINKSILAGIAIAIILITFTVVKLMSNKKSVEEKIYIPDVDAPVLVEVVNPTMHTFEDEFSYLGTFEPFRQNLIGAGSPVVEITDISKLKLTVNIPERDIQKFKLNQSISITSDQVSASINGKISNISVQADKSHNFKVQITVNNANKALRAGMYGSAVIQSDYSVANLSIPRKAIVGSLKNPQVYVVRDGKAKLVSFGIGLSEGDVIEVRSGLRAGDKIVVRGQINLRDNKNVKIAQ